MNISELAKELGVAVSTVSRVLSGKAEKYRISETTVARVREAADRYRVTPDPLGAGLRKGKSGIVGLLVPDITNPFFSQLARAIESRLRTSGTAVQLCDSAEDPATEIDLIRTLLGRRLDALVVAPVGRDSDELRDLITNSPMPVLMVDRPLPGGDDPTVSLDNCAAGRLAAEHLLEAGHTRIACLRGDPESRADCERFSGVSEAVQRHPSRDAMLIAAGSGYGPEESRSAAAELLSTHPVPTGFITLGGQGILGLLAIVRERGLRIPEDLSVVAFDEQPWSSLIEPPLTTIAQPIDEMADRVAAELEASISSPSEKRDRTSTTYIASLIKRSSVASPS